MQEGLGTFLFKALLLGAILLMVIFNFIQIESLERRLRDNAEQQQQQHPTRAESAQQQRADEALPEGTVREGNMVILPSGIVLVPTTYPHGHLATTLEAALGAEDAFAARLEKLQASLSDEEAARLRELIAKAQQDGGVRESDDGSEE